MSFTEHSEKIMSVSAILIAIASIFISVWEGNETRKHNRLSVSPKLEIKYYNNKNDFGYVVSNNGLGPAIIINKKLFVDNSEVEYTGFSGHDDFLEKLDIKNRLKGHGALGTGISIKAGDNVNIVSFKYLKSDEKEKLYMQVYQRVAIEIEYKSIYGERFTCRIPGTH